MFWIETVAALLGVACVVLTVRQNIWCWPTGLAQVVLYSYIFYEVKLYSDLILHLIYIGLGIYGWVHWLRGRHGEQALPVTCLTRRSLAVWGVVVAFGTLSWGWLMANQTDAAIPYGDAFTTVASLVAQWLMARKRLESWLFWIVVDVVAIGIYWSKDLQQTSILYALFLGLATLGYIEWRRSWREAQA